MARALSAAFAGCGTTPTLSVPLSLAALDQLNGDVTDAALKRQRFRPHALSSLGMTDNGDVAWVKAQIRGQCGKVVGFEAFGLPLDGSLSGSRQPRPLPEPEVRGKLMNAVPPLKWNALLAGAAARHAGDMVRLNFRGHVNPTDGNRPPQRVSALRFVGVAGENVAYGPITAQEAVQQLLTSPAHCENLMDPHWTQFGGAVNNGTADTLFPTYWVQVFGMERR